MADKLSFFVGTNRMSDAEYLMFGMVWVIEMPSQRRDHVSDIDSQKWRVGFNSYSCRCWVTLAMNSQVVFSIHTVPLLANAPAHRERPTQGLSDLFLHATGPRCGGAAG
jgi:hypothetical protein